MPGPTRREATGWAFLFVASLLTPRQKNVAGGVATTHHLDRILNLRWAVQQLPLITDGVVHSVCPHDCADTCSMLSTVEGGRLKAVAGNPDHPVTQGFLCKKLMRAPERVYSAERILHPMKRTGAKGGGQFEPISWDQAIADITDNWKRIIDEDGPLAVLPFCGSGTEGVVNGDLAGKRFFNRLGTLQLVRTICTRAGRTGYRYTMGQSVGADPTRIGDCKLVIAWGVNTPSTNIHQHPFFRQARQGGAKFAVVNPLRIKGSDAADLVIRPRPASDAALALGMMNVIVEDGLEDRDFIDRFTIGFDAFRRRLAEYPPDRAAALTGLPADEIRAFARLYAEQRPSFISIGPGCQRHSNGGMTLRTLACLPALVGAYRRRGGGAYFPTSTVFPVGFGALEGGEMRPNPAAGYNMIHLGRMLSEPGAPTIRSLYVYQGNPATTLYDQNRVRRGLARDDLFTVVHEQVMTDTARYADIVLPATSQFEQPDLMFSYYQPSLLLNRPAIAPVAEARSNLDTFNALADAMGFEEPCFKQNAWQVIDEILDLDHPAMAEVSRHALLADGCAPVPADDGHDCFLKGRFPTPSGRIELFSETMAAMALDPLPSYTPPREGEETTPDLFARYPLRLLTPSAHSMLNSAYAPEAGGPAGEDAPTLIIHPRDAEARGVSDGDRVRVFNDRGACGLTAHIDAAVRPGVVVGAGLWWSSAYAGGGNANHTTPDFPADMGGGSSFNTNLVQVEVWP